MTTAPAPARAASVILVAGVLLSAALALWVHANGHERDRIAFDRLANAMEREVVERFDKTTYGLKGALANFAAARDAGMSVSRSQFRSFVMARQIDQDFPGLRGFGFIQPVQRGGLERFVAAERADGAPEFDIRQLAQRDLPELYVIKFIEPLERNAAAVGLDVGSEPRRRTALLSAVDSGQVAISEPVALVQDGQQAPGFLIFKAFYRTATADAVAELRRPSLAGVLYAPVVARELLAGLPALVNDQIQAQLWGGPGASELVFDTAGTAERASAPVPEHRVRRPITILGSRFVLEMASTPAFASGRQPWQTWLAFGAGLLLTLLLARIAQQSATGRERAEALAASMTADLQRLAMVARRTTDAVVITDTARRITWVNEGFERMTGWTAREALGRTPGALLQFDGTDEATVQTMREALNRAESFHGQLRNRGRDGRVYWVSLEIQPLFAPDGTHQGFMAIEADITERRALEDKLRGHGQTLQSIVDNLPCGLSVFDGELRLVAANRRYRELLDFPDRLFGPEPPTFETFIRYNAERGEYGPGDPELLARERIAQARGLTRPHRFERRRPDGTTLEVRGGPMPGGGFVTTYTDVTEQRVAEEALAQRGRLMRLVIDCFPGALAHWDAGLRCTIANRAYRDWGFDPEAMVGRTQQELFGAELFARNEAAMRAALRGEVQCVERSRTLPDGSTMHYLLWYHPDRDGDTVRGFVSTVIDITDIKRSQIALEERTAQAEEATAAKSRFLANMSHEIRTPMNAILGMLTLLRRTALTPRQADYAARTEGAARSLLGLLNDILDFSKVEADRMVLEAHAFSLDALLGDLSVLLAASTGGRPVELLFDVEAGLPATLIGDALRLQQVLVNLAGNAIKFTAAGEVVLSVRRLPAAAGHARLAFAVRDTGIGIAPEHHELIFTGFAQAEASTTRRYGGSGLGLAISRRIVALMGGTLRLDSTPGAGSTFSFEVELAVGEDTGDALPCDARRVLVVDDHPLALEVLQRAAASLGWQVEAASGGAAALAAAEAALARGRPFDAVFVDWVMPGMDGWETVRALRRLPGGGRHLAVVMVTAQGREELASRSEFEQGRIDGFLVKPVTAGMLARAVAGAGRPLPSEAAPPRAPALQGVRLLVVEDHPNNQRVARDLLEDEGAVVTVAANGLEALATLGEAPRAFDLVLMDLQMPVMDGLEATRRLRAQPATAALPIVAMTANAMPSDVAACLAAGMNAHVGKPIDLGALVATVLAQLGRPPPAPALPAGAALGPAQQAAAAAAGVALDSALARLGGHVPVYTRLLRGFLDELTALPAQLRAAAPQDATGLARTLHTARGACATLGIDPLTAALATAEAALPQGTAAALLPLCAALEAARAPLADLAASLGHQAAPATPAPAPDTVPRQLQRIAALLADNDLAALEALATLAATLGEPPPPWFGPLDAAVQAMDFEAALQHGRAALEAEGATAN